MIRIMLFALALFSAAPAFANEDPGIRLTPESIERGRLLYNQYCLACHGLKFYRGEDAKDGLAPAMDPAAAETAFGVAPPDLSLMAASRGRGEEGAAYIFRLLTTYYASDDGQVRNSAFAEETKGDGAIAMPPPIPMDDPALAEKSRDISAFLLKLSDPSGEERERLGPWVLAYMAVLTALLYLLNRYTWKEVKKKLKR